MRHSPIFETRSPEKEFTGRHSDLLEAISPSDADFLKNSVAKSLETITEQPTYLEIDFFSADKIRERLSAVKGRASFSSHPPQPKEMKDEALSPIKMFGTSDQCREQSVEKLQVIHERKPSTSIFDSSA